MTLRNAPLLAVLLLAASCATAPQKTPGDDTKTEAEIHYQAGAQALAKGNAELAYFELAKSVRLKPDEAKYRYALGTAQLGRREYSSALAEFDATTRLDPRFADAYNNKGVVYLAQERWDDAIRSFNQAIDQLGYTTPENALANMGYAYFKKNDFPQALEHLKRSLAIQPENSVASKTLAEVYMAAGRLEKAREVLLQLVERDPNYVAGHLQLGIVFYKTGDKAKAKEEFATVVRLAPKGSEDAGTARSYLDLID